MKKSASGLALVLILATSCASTPKRNAEMQALASQVAKTRAASEKCQAPLAALQVIKISADGKTYATAEETRQAIAALGALPDTAVASFDLMSEMRKIEPARFDAQAIDELVDAMDACGGIARFDAQRRALESAERFKFAKAEKDALRDQILVSIRAESSGPNSLIQLFFGTAMLRRLGEARLIPGYARMKPELASLNRAGEALKDRLKAKLATDPRDAAEGVLRSAESLQAELRDTAPLTARLYALAGRTMARTGRVAK